MGKSILQYYCGNCNSILKEAESELQLSHSVEPCPHCGTVLSNTLQKRITQKPPHILKPFFTKASKVPKLTLGIPKLDAILYSLSPNQKICISGIHTQKVIERICVRSQLPHRYGGLNTKVLLIDGANSSDLYQCVDFAQQYGLDVRKVLQNIITSRTFTVYQLANVITHELNSVIQAYNAKVVVITNLLHFFTNDPYLNSDEMQQILKTLIKSLQKIKNCLVIVSLGFPTQYDQIVLKLFSKNIRITQSYNALSVNVNDNGVNKSVFIQKDELETVYN